MVLFLGLVFLLLILVSVLPVSTWINIRRGHRQSGQRPSCSVVHFSSRGRARWVGERRWRLSRRHQSSRVCLFVSLNFSLWGKKTLLFVQGKVSCISLPLGMPVAKRDPTPCYHDAYPVGTPNGAFLERGWLKHCKTMVSTLFGHFFLVCKRTIYFLGGWWFGCFTLGRPCTLGLVNGFLLLVNCLFSLLMFVAG